jgi:ABC-type xylose transport system substrate-binding protein
MTSPVLAETCKEQFPKPYSAMSVKELSKYSACRDLELKEKGVVVDYSDLRESRFYREQTNLLEEQNKLLKRQVENQEDFNNRVLTEIESD